MDESALITVLENANDLVIGVIGISCQIRKVLLDYNPSNMASTCGGLAIDFSSIGLNLKHSTDYHGNLMGLVDANNNLTKEVAVGVLAHEYGHIYYRREVLQQFSFKGDYPKPAEEAYSDEFAGFVLGLLGLSAEPFKSWLSERTHLRQDRTKYPEHYISLDAIDRGWYNVRRSLTPTKAPIKASSSKWWIAGLVAVGTLLVIDVLTKKEEAERSH